MELPGGRRGCGPKGVQPGGCEPPTARTRGGRNPESATRELWCVAP